MKGDGINADLRHAVAVLRRFDQHAVRNLSVIGGLSFLAGAAEAGILALVTSVAVDATTDNASSGLSSGTRLWMALALVFLSFLIGTMLARISATVSANSSERARQQLLWSFHDASYERKAQDRAATLQEALTTYVDRFATGFAAMLNLVSASLSLCSFAVMAVLIDVRTALAMVVVGMLIVFIQRPAGARTKVASRALVARRAEYARGATESVLLARELAVFGTSAAARDELLALDRNVADQFRRTKFLAAMTPRVYQTVAFLLVVGGLAVVSKQAGGDITAVAAVALILLRALSYGQALLSGAQQLAEYRPYLTGLTDLLDSYHSDRQTPGTKRIGTIETIRFDGVQFAYDPGQPVIDSLDLSISRGQTIGVIGPSGAGKTTFVNLLLRLYAPTGGSISVNEANLEELDDTEWHRQVAIVPQDPRLIHGTVADNIRFLRPISDDAVRSAAAAANIAEFIEHLPAGYDSPVGELGSGLSGGQRQRICIARALAGSPELLVLDEPTSALDGESEKAIQHTLESLSGRVTMVIVAHRLSTLSICDRIAIIDRGRLLAFGTPEDLRESSPYYREALSHAGL